MASAEKHSYAFKLTCGVQSKDKFLGAISDGFGFCSVVLFVASPLQVMHFIYPEQIVDGICTILFTPESF